MEEGGGGFIDIGNSRTLSPIKGCFSSYGRERCFLGKGGIKSILNCLPMS